MQADTIGIAATELHGDDAAAVRAAALAGSFTLPPMEESETQRVQRVLGPKQRDDAWAKVRRDEQRDDLADLNSRITTTPETYGPMCDECEGHCLKRPPVAGAVIDLRIGQHVRHRDFKGKRVTGVVMALRGCPERGLMVEIALDEPIVIDPEGQRPINIYRQDIPAHELSAFDERDELIAELRLACEGLLSVAETGMTSLGAIRAGRAVIAKAKGGEA